MSQLREAADLLLPLLLGGATLMLLLLMRRLLRRRMRSRALGLVYVGAAALLVAAIVLGGEGLLPAGLGRQLIVAALLVAWGYIIFDLGEELLVGRTLAHGGLAVPRLGRDILRGLALVALVLLAVNRVFGVPLSSLVISSTVASAVLGLALQDLLKDVIAGVALQTERPYGPGDWLVFQGQPARVVEMNWRATRLVTVDSTHIVVPNAAMAQAELSNYSLITPLQALHVQVALSPDHPPNHVKQVLAAAAAAAEGVLADPPPGARLVAFGEYSVTYDIKFWMRGFERHVETRDAVMTSVWYHARRAGLRLPYPVRDVLLHQADPRTAAGERERRTAEATGHLAAVDLFGALSPAERAELAERSELRTYAAGEALMRQGEQGRQLFVICKGAVRVEAAPAPGAAPVRLNLLRPGDVIGELSLLTGSPRRASVFAEEDTEALLVSREAIAPLLEHNPALPERLSAILEHRLAESRTLMAEAASAGPANGADMSQPSLLRRIRSLFGLS